MKRLANKDICPLLNKLQEVLLNQSDPQNQNIGAQINNFFTLKQNLSVKSTYKSPLNFIQFFQNERINALKYFEQSKDFNNLDYHTKHYKLIEQKLAHIILPDMHRTYLEKLNQDVNSVITKGYPILLTNMQPKLIETIISNGKFDKLVETLDFLNNNNYYQGQKVYDTHLREIFISLNDGNSIVFVPGSLSPIMSNEKNLTQVSQDYGMNKEMVNSQWLFISDCVEHLVKKVPVIGSGLEYFLPNNKQEILLNNTRNTFIEIIDQYEKSDSTDAIIPVAAFSHGCAVTLKALCMALENRPTCKVTFEIFLNGCGTVTLDKNNNNLLGEGFKAIEKYLGDKVQLYVVKYGQDVAFTWSEISRHEMNDLIESKKIQKLPFKDIQYEKSLSKELQYDEPLEEIGGSALFMLFYEIYTGLKNHKFVNYTSLIKEHIEDIKSWNESCVMILNAANESDQNIKFKYLSSSINTRNGLFVKEKNKATPDTSKIIKYLNGMKSVLNLIEHYFPDLKNDKNPQIFVKDVKDKLDLYNKKINGKLTDDSDGLFQDELESNLELIKKSIDSTAVNEKLVLVSDLNISNNQKLYIINPEGIESKFNKTLQKALNNTANVINADIQRDNSTCCDHSLILLTKILELGIPLSEIGIATVENEHGKHANLYIIADNNIDLSNQINKVINSYKQESGIIDVSHDNTDITDYLATDNLLLCKNSEYLDIQNNTENIVLLGAEIQA